MESITQNVKDIEAPGRQWLESKLGYQLQDNQQVTIFVLPPVIEPDAATRQAALKKAAEIAHRGRENAKAAGVDEAEIDSAIDEALQHVRKNKR